MLQLLKDLSIRLKISAFVIPSTIFFGITMTCLALFFLNDFKKTTLGDFDQLLQQIQVVEGTDGANQNTEKLLAEIAEKADVKLRNTAFILISIVTAVIIMATIGALIISGLIGKPVKKVADGLENMSSGDADLTQRLPTNSNDETGKVSQFFNLFLEKLHGIIKQLQASGLQLNKAAASIYSLLRTIQKKTASAKDLSQVVFRSAGYMSKDMAEVSNMLEESTGIIHEISSAVEELSQTVNEIAETSSKAHTNTENTKSKMELLEEDVQKLGQAGNDISKVTETITEISSQVNLLALNATIEAARAGEAGKGFAVVANEIKELAKQTAEAATEIQQRIDQVQTVTKSTINGIDEAAELVSENTNVVAAIATAVEEQTATISEISGSLNGASENLDYASKKVSEASGYASDMAEKSNSVTDAVVEADEAVLSIMETSKVLKELAVDSVRTTRQFKT
ncbi:MAG: methyl-accepting chemotaxis protein [Desulfotalea sp.]